MSPASSADVNVETCGGFGHHSFHFPVTPDQIVRRTVVLELKACLAFEFGNNALCEHLAQFHAPLIERVDVPDRPLREDAVFVESDELAKISGVSRSARIVFDGRLPSKTRCGTSHSGMPSACTCSGFAKCQRLALRETLASSMS